MHEEKTMEQKSNRNIAFWLANGVILLRHTHPVFGGQENTVLGKRMSVILGVVAILAGLLVISRVFTRQVLPEGVVIQVLGVVILLTGILHLLGEFRIGRYIKQKRTTAQKFLAVFEILLGVLLIYSPLELSPVVYLRSNRVGFDRRWLDHLGCHLPGQKA